MGGLCTGGNGPVPPERGSDDLYGSCREYAGCRFPGDLSGKGN